MHLVLLYLVLQFSIPLGIQLALSEGCPQGLKLLLTDCSYAGCFGLGAHAKLIWVFMVGFIMSDDGEYV